jgi:L-threo-3-deoxy-hexylosonate aldolase
MGSTGGTALKPGVYAPVITPFEEENSNEVNLRVFKLAVIRLARAGVGLVLSGTLGEGSLLTRHERVALIQVAREALKEIGLDGAVPIIAGVSGGGVTESLLYAKDAATAGADAV